MIGRCAYAVSGCASQPVRYPSAVTIEPADFVTSFARGLSVIRALASLQGPLSLREVAEATDMSRPAARRFLLTLVELGYARSENGHFELTPRVLELGYSYLAGLRLPEIAMAHIEALAAQLQESVAVAALDGTDIVYVARVPSQRVMRLHIEVGTRFPAHLTSMGRVLLADLSDEELAEYCAAADFSRGTIADCGALAAELRRVRKQGYSLVEDELDYDVRGVSVPLRDARGRCVAALNISVHIRADPQDALRDVILPALIATAKRIEEELALISAGAAT
jgi:IclR family transcriptional regulator, pca regulon regulatory protein